MKIPKYILLTACLLFPGAAFAWNLSYVVDAPIRWHSDANTVGFKIQASSFPVGSPFRAGLMGAFSLLNQNPSLIRARVNDDTEWVSVGNGQNEIWFTDNSLVNNGAPAICISHFNPFAFGVWNMMEADVIFNPSEPYTSSTSTADNIAYGGPLRPIQTTALHELGHAMGIKHENRVYNIMGEDFTHLGMNGGRIIPSRGEDVTGAFVRAYGGNASAPKDVGVSTYKYRGVDGEYSRHQRTLFRGVTTGEEAEPFIDGGDGADPGQLVYRVNAGQIVLVEFTFENNGLDSIPSLMTHIVLSNNRTITTLDRLLLAQRVPFTRDRPLTRSFLVRLPADLPRNSRQYVGVIVDAENTLVEATKRNNATFIPIHIR